MDIVNVAYLGSDGQYQTYLPSEAALINKSLITATFGDPNDYIEYFIKDLNNEVLSSNYNATQYQIGSVVDPETGTTTELSLDPEADARNAGYNRGVVNLKYNFFTRQLVSSPTATFWIKEISPSRTEIKVARQDLSNSELQAAFTDFSNVLAADAYYPDFLINFGLDRQIIGVNAVYVEEGSDAYIIFKLYEPLPLEFDVTTTFWVVTTAADPAEFNVSIQAEPEAVQGAIPLRGPNYKVSINEVASQTTGYYNYASLFSTTVSSSYQQLQSLMDERGIQINVDYSDFSNFTHFSSVTERLYNFVYKLQLIESASAGIAGTNTTSAKLALQNTIDNTIAKFDGYEYYLYFTSASTAWPKSTSTQPYALYSVSSSEAHNWLGGINVVPTATTMSMYYSASQYDNNNKDLLQYSTPAYLREDSGNQPYLVFLNMIGQHFDNIWIYLKDVTNRYSAENNPFVGISMDQVADALRSLGMKLYTNTSISDNVYYSMLGINPNGSLLPPTGSEVINNYVTSSIPTLPGTQIENEQYKRLYHNLAYLYKTRGTERGVRALVNTFGIPNEILSAHEYGGYDIYTVPGIVELTNNKILTSSYTRQIQTTLLSPNTTIQYYSNDYMKSSIDVEVGFSPADSINAAITSSGFITSSTQPGYFNIMQYIGAPELQYSSSYEPLVTLSDAYFAANYTNRYNVWDFIRIIKYYNNSLFKMLRDWMPARSSALTGIVIKSHLLERNKYPRHEPTYITSSNTGSILMLTVSGSPGGSVTSSTEYVQLIPLQYNGTASANFSQSIGTIIVPSRDNVQRYTGEFGGSFIEMTTREFNQDETSTYAYPPTSSVPAPAQILYSTYSVSPIAENVYTPVRSQRFLELDYNNSQLAPTNFGLVTQSQNQTLIIGAVSQSAQPYSEYAYIQDYNYNLRPTVYARYSGSTISSQYYNVYTTGDTSYGNDPTINYYTNKLGYFTQIATSSFLPGKVNAQIAYLADVSGGLFELNQNNKHWEDVQNIFKAGTTLTVKQFDNKKYSNQVATDGVKRIYSSGYNYTPQIYFVSGTDNSLYFQYTSLSTSDVFTAQNSGIPNNYVNGYTSNQYPLTYAGFFSPYYRYNLYNLFDQIVAGASNYVVGSPGGPYGTYTVSQTTLKSFTTNLNININLSTYNQTASFTQIIALNGTDLIADSRYFISTPETYIPAEATQYSYGITLVTAPSPSVPATRYYGPLTVYRYDNLFNPANTTYLLSSTEWIEVKPYTIFFLGGGPRIVLGITAKSSGVPSTIPLWNVPLSGAGSPYNFLSYVSPRVQTGGGLSGSISFNVSTPPILFNAGDTVAFRYEVDSTIQNFTASVSTGTNSLLTVGNYGQGSTYATATSSQSPFIVSASNSTNNQATIVFNQSLSQYQGWQFIPYFESGSYPYTDIPVIYSSSLYTTYGDVNVPFEPTTQDAVVLADNTGLTVEFSLLQDAYISGSSLVMDVTPYVPSNWASNPSLIKKVLVLKRYKDEQNLIMTFNKPPGITSYGFLIPNKTNPEVLASINTLQASVQSQTLSTQAGN